MTFRQPFAGLLARLARPSALPLLLLLLLALGSAGCGGGKASVSGKVTLDGAPLPAGTIAFVPKSGPAVSAEIKNGEYSAAGVPTGEVGVTVETDSVKQARDLLVEQAKNDRPHKVAPGTNVPPEAKAMMERQAKAAGERVGKLKQLQAAYKFLPPKYNKADTSGLTVKVAGPETKHDVALTAK